MPHYACINATTHQLNFIREFDVREIAPTDLPHKSILWRPVVEVHPPHDSGTHMEEGTIDTVTDTEFRRVYQIVPRPVPTMDPQVRKSRGLRSIQSNFFTPEKLPLTSVVFELYNEVRVLKHLPPVTHDEFLKVLQHYV